MNKPEHFLDQKSHYKFSKAHSILFTSWNLNPKRKFSSSKKFSVIALFFFFLNMLLIQTKRDLTVPEQLACRDLYPPDDTLPWKLQAGHNMQGLEWRLSACTAHRCDKAGRLEAGAHRPWSSCHPTRPGNVKDGWFPGERLLWLICLWHGLPIWEERRIEIYSLNPEVFLPRTPTSRYPDQKITVLEYKH